MRTSVGHVAPILGRLQMSGVQPLWRTACNAKVLGARTARNQVQHRHLRKATIRACSSAALRTRSSQINGAASPMGRSSSAWAASPRILPTRREKRFLACGSRLSPSARLTRHASSSVRAWRPCARRQAFEMLLNSNCMTRCFSFLDEHGAMHGKAYRIRPPPCSSGHKAQPGERREVA